jgi:hypothetical protein
LRARFPDVHAQVNARRLAWVGELQPTPLSRAYLVELTYLLGRSPRVNVPDLAIPSEADSLPHIYGDGSLCLNESGEWSPHMFLADTTVPWTSEWLAHYEIWLATGTWYGGGEWPPRRAVASSNPSRPSKRHEVRLEEEPDVPSKRDDGRPAGSSSL